jgi:DNA-binding MarR family transcriptional regulator
MHAFAGITAMRKIDQTFADADPTPCNCLAVRQAARQVTQLYDRHLAPAGLRSTQYSILSKLGRLGPLSVNALAASMAMDRTTLGRAIRPLQREKLLAVGADADDKRARVIKLTVAGETRLKAASARWKEAQKEFEAAYGVGKAARLRSSLAEVVAAL